MKSTFAQSAQRQLEGNTNNSSFKASSMLHASLSKEYKRPENSQAVTLMATGKDFVKQARIVKETRQVQQTLASEVASLPKYHTPQYREETHLLIERQKESRRDRHIKLNNEFERWVSRLNKNIDEAYKDIKRDIQEFFGNSDQEINKYYESLTDESLLVREIDFMESLRSTVEEHKDKRDKKINNLDEKLDELERERQRSLELFCMKLQNGLIDIAFELEPEIMITVNAHRQVFSEQVESKQQDNETYFKEVSGKQLSAFEEYREIQKQKEQRWRDLKHEHYIKEFNKDIQELQYVYPELRTKLYLQFKNTQQDIYQQRVGFVERLNAYEIGTLTKSIVERWQEETKSHNELVSQTIDVCVKNLVDESDQTHQHNTQRYNVLVDQLHYAGAHSVEVLDEMLKSEYLTQVAHLNKTARDLLQSAIQYYEAMDQQQMDILTNLGAFYFKIANKNDEYKTDMQLMNHNYELTKAQAADKNDEIIDELTKQLNIDKQLLKEALHHPKLEECLTKCNNILDQFTAEYDRFYEDNLKITNEYPTIIMNKHQYFERQALSIFEYVDQSKAPEIIEKQRRITEIKAKYAIAKEEYLKKVEEEKLIEEAKNKKGGKAPTSKPKDPKKYQQELEDRMKVVMKELGAMDVQKYSSELKQEYIFQRTMQEIVERLYISPDDIEQVNAKEAQEKQEILQYIEQQSIAKDPKAKPQAPPPIELPTYIPEEDVPPKSVDHVEESPENVLGTHVLASDTVFTVTFLNTTLDTTKVKLIEYIKSCLQSQEQSAESSNQQFMQQCQQHRDECKSRVQPDKQQIKETIYDLRAQQITIHKKRYERYAKQLVERIDQQTEQINFYLEGGLLDMREYNKEQSTLRQGLQVATTLAKLQGIQNQAKEQYFKFGEKINDLDGKLLVLANQELDVLLQKNKDFLRDCKHMKDGGEYSQDEVEWYQQLMEEHNNTINRLKQQRNQKLEEIKKILGQKRQDQLDKFEIEYAVAVEDLAAKDGTGKKYGRPRRLAQERLRAEMTKCEKAQECINDKLKKIKEYYQEYKQAANGYFAKLEPTHSIKVRRVLIGVLVCIKRYATHIEALKPDNKSQEMPKVTWKENKYDTVMEPEEIADDKQQTEYELESLGPLYYSGDKKFHEYVLDIEKQIKDEATKIYADKPKFLTGADKIPDYLRTYIENMQRSTVEFRISAIRELRNSCEELSELSHKINEMTLDSIKLRGLFNLQLCNTEIWNRFKLEQTKQDGIKKLHQKKLRPNLGNPQCKEELTALCADETQRFNEFTQLIKEYEKQLLDSNFTQGEIYFKCCCQNFEVLLMYYDSTLLFEDFVKLPGDEQIQKKHQNLKVSLRQKQKGIVIDTNSERSLSKAWDGVLIERFNVGEHVIQYVWQPNQKETKEVKGKEAPKKPAPAGKAQADVPVVSTTHTMAIKSFKTYRQKSAKHEFVNGINQFTEQLKKAVDYAREELRLTFDRELKFQFKWEQSVNSL